MTDDERIERAAYSPMTRPIRRTVRDFAPHASAARGHRGPRAAGSARAARTSNRGVLSPCRTRDQAPHPFSRGSRGARVHRHRATEGWLQALAVLGTDADSPFSKSRRG
jgi:hypothetical protein